MPRSRQELRSEETKQAILSAARQLFTERGYDAVTMREIAKAAECSHTTIYIYFKDKEDLLHHLSMEPLETLRQQIASVLAQRSLTPDEKLLSVSRSFIQFCLSNRSMYALFFMAKASRVDVEQQDLEIQRLRNQLFAMLKQAVQECLQLDHADDLLLAYARIYFFHLHGIVGTYTSSSEPLDQLLERLTPTFELALEVMLAGFRETLKKSGTR